MRNHWGVVLRQEDVVEAIRWWVVGVAVCGLVFGLDRLAVLQPARETIERGVWWIDKQMGKGTQVMGRPLRILREMVGWQERVAKLEDQLAMAAVERQKLASLEAQVELLTPMVAGYQQGKKAQLIAELFTRGEMMEVGVGEVNGVIEGMAVTDKNGVLVGRVERVGRYVSRVERVGTNEWRIPAQTVSGRAKGIVYFDGSEVVLGEVLQAEELNVGDVVVSGGVGGELPTGLVIGQVVAVESNQADVTKKGVMKLLGQSEGWVALW